MKLFTTILASTIIAFASAGQVYTGTNNQHRQTREFTEPEQQYQQQRHLIQARQQKQPIYQIQQRRHQEPQIAHSQARPQYQVRPEYHQEARPEQAARILSYNAQNNGHNYQYSYETDNGIKAQEVGQIIGKGIAAQGEYSYTGDDGQTYTVTYTADQFGFRPQGDHLPTPPPIPEAIAKALEQNAQDAANGIYDDGSYKQQPTQDHQQLTQDYQQTPQDYQQSPQDYQQSPQDYQQYNNHNYLGSNSQQTYQQSYQQPQTYQQSYYQYQPTQAAVSNIGRQ